MIKRKLVLDKEVVAVTSLSSNLDGGTVTTMFCTIPPHCGTLIACPATYLHCTGDTCTIGCPDETV